MPQAANAAPAPSGLPEIDVNALFFPADEGKNEKFESEKEKTPPAADKDPSLEKVTGEEKKPEKVDDPAPEGGEEETSDSLISFLQTSLGYETEDEYEETEEGLLKLWRDTADKYAEDQFTRLLSEYPTVKALLGYLMQGGDERQFAQTFFQETDYSKLELRERDYSTQKRVLRADLSARGFSEEEIDEEIDTAESAGKLMQKAERALQRLRDAQAEERDTLVKRQAEAADKQRREQEALQQKARTLIKEATELRGLPISEKDKAAFEDYLFKPGADGRTPYEKAVAEADLQTEITAAYLMFRGFDLSSIIERKAKTAQVRTLKERLKNAANLPKSSAATERHSAAKNTQAVVDNIDHSAIFG